MDNLHNLKIPITVAYADDHIAVRKGIISYLHDLGGIKVILEANNGRELIEQLDKCTKRPDVCLIDIKMPEMNGFETVSIIKQKWADQKILILSTYTEDMYVIRMIRAGVNGFLSKACDPEEIKKALISIFRDGVYSSDLYVEKAMLSVRNPKLMIPNLSERERRFLILSCSDYTYAQIAQVMVCTAKSVEGYRDSLFKKLQIKNRASLVLFAIKSGIVPIDSSPIL